MVFKLRIVGAIPAQSREYAGKDEKRDERADAEKHQRREKP